MNRFESLVARAEAAQPGAGAGLQAQISSSSAPAQAAPSGGASDELVAAFHKACFGNLDNLLKATNAIDTPNKKILADGVDLYIKMLKSQEAIIRTMGTSKETMSTDDMTAIVTNTKDKLFKMGGPKGKEFKFHLLVIEDTCELFYWFLRPDDPVEFKEMLGENFGGIDFSGAKVRDQEGLHKTWFQAIRKVH